MTLVIDCAGHRVVASQDSLTTIGRDGDFVVDDNPFLHRRFMTVAHRDAVWILANVGSQLAATVSDSDGRLEAFLAPGAAMPIVFRRTLVRFTAGSTTYELVFENDEPVYDHSFFEPTEATSGLTTTGKVGLTADQRLLILALAESALTSAGGAAAVLPTSALAAHRLGWTTKRFVRKLDNVCEKLDKLGVRGLHGGVGTSASNRRARLVEYAMATRLVTREDLIYLEKAQLERAQSSRETPSDGSADPVESE